MESHRTILDGCRLLRLPLPVSAADLHETYATFLREGFEPNTTETPCWRGVCDCLQLYGSDPGHATHRQRILDHITLLCQTFRRAVDRATKRNWNGTYNGEEEL